MTRGERKAYEAAWRAANRDKINAKQRAYRASKPPTNRKGTDAAYYAKNSNKIKQRNRDYVVNNRDKIRVAARLYEAAWRAANRDKINAKKRRRYAANLASNRAKNSAKQKRRYAVNPGKMKASRSARYAKEVEKRDQEKAQQMEAEMLLAITQMKEMLNGDNDT